MAHYEGLVACGPGLKQAAFFIAMGFACVLVAEMDFDTCDLLFKSPERGIDGVLNIMVQLFTALYVVAGIDLNLNGMVLRLIHFGQGFRLLVVLGACFVSRIAVSLSNFQGRRNFTGAISSEAGFLEMGILRRGIGTVLAR